MIKHNSVVISENINDESGEILGYQINVGSKTAGKFAFAKANESAVDAEYLRYRFVNGLRFAIIEGIDEGDKYPGLILRVNTAVKLANTVTNGRVWIHKDHMKFSKVFVSGEHHVIKPDEENPQTFKSVDHLMLLSDPGILKIQKADKSIHFLLFSDGKYQEIPKGAKTEMLSAMLKEMGLENYLDSIQKGKNVWVDLNPNGKSKGLPRVRNKHYQQNSKGNDEKRNSSNSKSGNTGKSTGSRNGNSGKPVKSTGKKPAPKKTPKSSSGK